MTAVLRSALVAAVGFGTAARATEIAPTPRAAGFEVEAFPDIAYRTGKGADPERHTLDVYVPKGVKDFPVLFFVHGGAWKSGNKGMYVPLGHTFAKLGFGTVVINYRLSPRAKHPDHIEDVAAAFAWTVANAGKYGGRADRIFVSGHSAGGHLVSLLATDEQYLKAVGRSAADIRGVVAVSGVYEIQPKVSLFQTVFGKDEAVCRMASPLTHVKGGLPPFLIAYAETEMPGLIPMAKDMHAALTKAACRTELCEIKSRNHISVIVGALSPSDPLTLAVRDFVRARE